LINDLKKLKLTPSLITLLKAIYTKDNTFLKQLDEVADVFVMAKHLQSKMALKIVGNKLDCKSFEIRDLAIIKYFDEAKIEVVNDSKKIFQHFKVVLEKYSGKQSRMKYATFKKFLEGRVNQGVNVDEANDIVSMKFEEWYGSDYQRHLNFQTLLGVTHYSQYTQQLDTFEPIIKQEFTDDI
jgi:uncharacterized phage protein (TIGR02220 family)